MHVRNDIAWAFRVLRRGPALSLAVIATLALGIGMNSAIFSVVYGVLLRPLPFSDPDRLVTIWMSNPREGIEKDITSYPNLLAWREGNAAFEQVVSVRNTTMNLTTGGDPEEVIGAMVTEGYFEMLGVAAEIGRTFTTEEQGPDGPLAVVLSHELWATRFGSDPEIIDRSIELNGRSYPVAGVMPSDLGDHRFWVPLNFGVTNPGLRESWGALWLPVMGRLRPGVPIERAQAEMDVIAARTAREQPSNEEMGVLLEPLHSTVVGDVRPGLMVLLGAVVLVLLIACANIANLLLARGTGRRREMAVRVALGARRSRILSQLFAESMLLAFAGGMAGLMLAIWGTDLLVAAAPSDLPRLGQVHVDTAVILFTLVVTMVAGVLFGLAPAWQAARRDPGRFLAEGGRGDINGSDRVRPVLVVSQFALALALLTAAGLLIRSFANLQSVDRGFDGANVLSVGINLPARSYDDAQAIRAFYDQLMPAIRETPGVESASLISTLFLSRLPQSAPIIVEGTPPETQLQLPVAYDAVSPDFFSTLRMDIVGGREFTAADGPDGQPVAIVNQAFVRRYLPRDDAVGRRFLFGTRLPSGDANWITIVGVSGDTRRSGLDQEDRPSAFMPFGQFTPNRMTVLVRAAADPLALVPRIRDAVQRVDGRQPLSNLRTLDQQLAQSVASRRFVMLLLVLFATCATVLAAVGIYGVMAYSVGRRTREIGVRMALGARRGQVLRLVVGQALRQAGLGLGAGVIAALLFGRLLEGQLFGVSATDPGTIAFVGLLLGAVAALASWLPAHRAAGVQPLEALRTE